MKIRSNKTMFFLLLVFVLGWCTEPFSMFDVGRYSFPLIFFAGLPFCLFITYRSLLSLALPIASSVFAIVIGLLQGVETGHILSQAVMQALAIAVAAGVAGIDWHEFTSGIERAVVFLGIPIVLYACYQMAARIEHLPGAFLPVTNQQYYADGGLQLGWEKAEITRASSVFSEPSELGFFCLWLFVIGLSTENKRVRILSISLAATGILVSQSLSAVLGTAVVFLAYCVIQGISRHLLRQIFLMAAAFGAIVLPLKVLAPEAFDHFSERIVEAASFDERADSGRVDHLPACLELIEASPVWGYGLSSMAGAGPDGADVTTVNYVMVWLERGTVGALLFFIPWFGLAFRTWLLPRDAKGRTFAFLLLVMTLCSFCYFSVTYFLPFWFAFGVIASLVLNTHAPVSSKSNVDVSGPSYALGTY
jgi:hypothetical protein